MFLSCAGPIFAIIRQFFEREAFSLRKSRQKSNLQNVLLFVILIGRQSGTIPLQLSCCVTYVVCGSLSWYCVCSLQCPSATAGVHEDQAATGQLNTFLQLPKEKKKKKLTKKGKTRFQVQNLLRFCSRKIFGALL